MTRVSFGPYRLHVEGHAGYAKDGVDPVCAGVSALGFTLLAAADDSPEFHTHVYANQQDGVLDVQCFPEEDAKESCEYLFHVVQLGMDLIASEFKDYLTITGGRNG